KPGPLASQPHGVECDTSCNRCLRDFANLPYHGLLDWRLALDMARLALSEANVIDLATAWEPRENPWRHLLEGTSAPVPATMQRLGYSGQPPILGLSVFTRQSGSLVRIACHPLWTEGHATYQQAKKVAETQYPGAKVQRLNPFRLLRRPADYVW